jgi:hypothetical protein
VIVAGTAIVRARNVLVIGNSRFPGDELLMTVQVPRINEKRIRIRALAHDKCDGIDEFSGMVEKDRYSFLLTRK